ncbi:radical SAM protein [Dysgonomonas sp. 25]|uniref:SPL family radical SAM protein n=1 Tax=Dysgonomonas sp. 25 TaxID=2302933 RepID=UPI0013D6E2A9|nr:radical SAM protein [Dysgonomonas sp. 25]NDV68733.1 radical SAM protein [Dysgonomonas sp. 25]
MPERQYIPVDCSSALNKLKRKVPYEWDLNIYRGCEHGCKYCYAIYSHDYLKDGAFFDRVYVKQNILEHLEKELRSPSWKRDIVNIGGVTDSYQPIEQEYQLMPEILKLLIKYKTPAIISTKSDLILRDYDLIDRLSRITYINVAATVTTMDESVRQQLEPNGCESVKRFAMLKEFRKTNASVGLHVMPIVPYLTDTEENIDSLFACAKDSNVHYALPGTLYLRGKTRPYFLEFIKTDYPQIYEQMCELYKKGGAGKEYKDVLYERVNRLRKKYNLSGSYTIAIKEKMYREPDLFSGM